MGMAAFRPTRMFSFSYYDLYPPVKVVSWFKGAVPSLTNSLSFFMHPKGLNLGERRSLEAELLFISWTTSYN